MVSTEAADLPGVNLTFNSSDAAPAATQGRVLDHIGVEVRNLPAFLAKLEAAGVKIDRPYTKIPNSSAAVAFFTDPGALTLNLPKASRLPSKRHNCSSRTIPA